jgi:hypothetical protein
LIYRSCHDFYCFAQMQYTNIFHTILFFMFIYVNAIHILYLLFVNFPFLQTYSWYCRWFLTLHSIDVTDVFFDKSSIKILSLIRFAQNGLLTTSQASPSMWYYSEKSILAKQINDGIYIRVITKLPNSEQSYKGKVKTHKRINRQNQSTTGKLWTYIIHICRYKGYKILFHNLTFILSERVRWYISMFNCIHNLSC